MEEAAHRLLLCLSSNGDCSPSMGDLALHSAEDETEGFHTKGQQAVLTSRL